MNKYRNWSIQGMTAEPTVKRVLGLVSQWWYCISSRTDRIRILKENIIFRYPKISHCLNFLFHHGHVNYQHHPGMFALLPPVCNQLLKVQHVLEVLKADSFIQTKDGYWIWQHVRVTVVLTVKKDSSKLLFCLIFLAVRPNVKQ